MNNKGKYLTPVSIGTATVWFSTHCGAGFASGTQELQFFANHGWFGPLMPILTIFLVALTYYVGLESARQTGLWNYDGWSKEAFKPLKWLSPFLDFNIIIITIAASAATIAAGANLVNQSFGIPMWIGSVTMFAIITLLCIFGEKVVRNNAMIMSAAILIIVTLIVVVGLIKFSPQIAKLYSEGYVNPQSTKWAIDSQDAKTPGSVWNALLWALTYTGFQAAAVGGIAAAFKGGQSKRESKGAMALGFVLNTVMLVGICLLIFSQMPGIMNDKQARLLPTVHIVNQLDIPALKVLYPLLLFLALVTTAVGFIFGMVTRLDPYVLKGMNNKLARRAIISLLSLLVCFAVSQLGLMWVVQVAYKYMGIYSWIFVIIPFFTVGFINIKKRNKLEGQK